MPKYWRTRMILQHHPVSFFNMKTALVMIRRPGIVRGLACSLLLAILFAPTPFSNSGATVVAQTGWQWYMVDTHTHSSISADALPDVGIHSAAANAQGYDALFLTDHNGASSFQINNLTANHMVFEDTYTRWDSGTYGSLNTSTNVLVSTPRNTGSAALRLASSSSGSGETYIWTKRGPNFRSGDITLKVSIYPTRIDPGSGVYVSVSIGGDPTVDKTPVGYTTQSGVVSPRKSTVLVWQLGTGRQPSTDPNARVLTYSLGAYTLNAWNTYTINVSNALQDIPVADRPLDYNGLTELKLTAAANNGTVDAYFDTYSIDAGAPVAPAAEYVYRTPKVDDFNTGTFKIFSSYEMGQQKHSNRFNFAITDPGQYVSYQYGTDGIPATQQSGYPAQLNHPGTTITVQEAINTKGGGADFLEVTDESWIDAWDAILQGGTQIIGGWSSDTHSGVDAGKPATFIYAPSLGFDQLLQSYYEGRAYSGRNNFPGTVAFNLQSGAQTPYPARYPVFVPDTQTSVNVHLAVSGGMTTGHTVRWIRNGSQIASEGPTAGTAYDNTKAITLNGGSTYVRAEVRSSSGSVKALTQPIFFLTVPGLPADKSYYVDTVTTPNGNGYTKISTKGITASSWSSANQSLSLTLQNPASSLVRLNVATNSAPQRLLVDGNLVAAAGSQGEFDAATNSSWFYDSAAQRLQVKARHTLTTADVQIAFADTTDTESPGAPTNLRATAINAGRVDLGWTEATDNVGVTGYNIYRDGVQLDSIGSATGYSDTTVAPATTYTYQVQARDAAGNVSALSNAAAVTTPGTSLFSDGFEAGNMSQWTSNTGLSVQQQEVRTGQNAARATSTGTAKYAYKQLGTAQNDLYYRTFFKLISKDSNTLYLQRFRTGTGASLLGVYISGSGKLGYRNDVAAASITSTQSVSTGVWHELQVHVQINGATSTTEVWFDGTRITNLSKTESLGTTPIGRIQLGENATARTFDVAFDDVVVNTSFINP